MADHAELATMYSRLAADEIRSRNDGSDKRAEQYLRLVDAHTKMAVATADKRTETSRG